MYSYLFNFVEGYFRTKYERRYAESGFRFIYTYDNNINVYVHPEKLFDIINTNSVSDAEPIFDALENIVKNADIVLDVGANIGIVSLWLAKRSKIVYCFEPDKSNVDFMKKNIELNAVLNIHIINNAVSNKPEDALFYTRKAFGHHGLERRHVTKSTKSELLKTITLDGFCLANDIFEVSILKIDVEGSELAVLEGFRNYLKKNKVKLIIFEHAPILLGNALESRLAVFNYLTGFGYTVYNLNHRIMNPDDMAVALQGDYYATVP